MSTDKLQQWMDELERSPLKKLPVPREKKKKEYEMQLVAFIDILGLSEKIRNNPDPDSADEIFKLMTDIRTCVDFSCRALTDEAHLRRLQLGDAFTITADFGCIDGLCEILSTIQWRALIELKMLIRGALTAGKVAIGTGTEFIVGPAFLDAYTLERENAIFPRIILANEIKRFKMNLTYIAEDTDKLRYIDYIKYGYVNGEHTKKTFGNLFITHGTKKLIKDEYLHKLEDNDPDAQKVAQKYGWLIKKLDHFGIKILA